MDINTTAYPFAYPQYQYPGGMFSSPVSSFYPSSNHFVEMTVGIGSETSPPSDPSSQKHRSPEEEAKRPLFPHGSHFRYRMKRNKNNEAAKASRKKRSDREKQLQEENNRLKQEIRNMAEQIQFLRHQNAQLQMVQLQAETVKGDDKENIYPYLPN